MPRFSNSIHRHDCGAEEFFFANDLAMFSNLVLEETRYEAIGDFEDGGNPVLPIPESERIVITGMGTGGSATAIEMTSEPVKLTPEER